MVRPRDIAMGIIAHVRVALGSISSQSLRSPTAEGEGQRGTLRWALPTLPAHQLQATAIWKARQAVYSASSLWGYLLAVTLSPLHSMPEWMWWQVISGQELISSMLCRNRCFLRRAPCKQHAS